MCRPNLTYQTLQEEFNRLMRLKDYKTGQGYFYQSAISEFFAFLKMRGYTTFEISGEEMAVYFHHLKTRPNQRREGTLSDNSVNHHLFAIKLLFDYLLDTKKCDKLPLLPRYVRRQTPPQEVLTVEEVRLLYNHCQSDLERSLLSIAYGCGLRRTEIQNLQFTDVDVRAGTITVRHGKGNKRRVVPMSDMVVKDLTSYIHNERRIDYLNMYALLVSPKGIALSGRSSNQLLKRIAQRIPELTTKSVTLHTLRRSIATHLLDQGAPIHFVKEFLGHSRIDTAQLYALKRKRKARLQ